MPCSRLRQRNAAKGQSRDSHRIYSQGNCESDRDRMTGTRGRSLDRDFHFQNKRASRHSKNLESWAIVNRMALLARRGFCFRSTYRPTCLRRNRFAAASAPGDRKISRRKVKISMSTPKTPLIRLEKGERLDIGDRIAESAKPFMNRN